jgi:uncharacterized membrane protein YphA (DoxX/SURF4 family)
MSDSALNASATASGVTQASVIADRQALSHLGIYAYGLTAILLGVIGFVYGDFATGWQRVPADVPFRTALAYITALCELVAGAALLWRWTARAGAAVLTILYCMFVLSWLREAAAAPGIYDAWGNVFEELSIVIGGMVLFASLAPHHSAWAAKKKLVTRLFGICPISFGLVHLISFRGAATWVPKWIPPGQAFWTAATAIFFFMSAAAILSGILAALAARLLTVMIFCFQVLIWIPKLVVAPHDHFMWAGNGIGAAIGAAAWVVSESLNESRKT